MKSQYIIGAAALLTLASCQSNCSSKTSSDNCPEKILVVIDVQRDFFDPSGSLYVGGSEALPEKIASIAADYDAVVFTLDWHPANHCSFAAQGGIWPSHCVAYTQGAGLADQFAEVMKTRQCQVFLKGMEQDKEQYGAFESLDCYPVILDWFRSCKSVDVCGIAGDYCVKESTRNILSYVPAEKVSILVDCVRSIDDGSALNAFISENGLGKK